MKILILEWRDIKNPQAGGSERYFHELAKRWVKWGHSVKIICGGWKDGNSHEFYEGIEIMRVGKKLTVYFSVPFAYFKIKDKPDVIIDVENGVPFFSPLFSLKKIILHIHHVHKDVWFKEIKRPYSYIGLFIESVLMPLVYKNKKIVTISKSSEVEIKKRLGITANKIVNPGIIFLKRRSYRKYKQPTILFLNRIKKYKGVKVLVDSCEILEKEGLKIKTLIAGSGDYLKEIEEYVQKRKIKSIEFLGKINEEEKQEIMQKSWIFINPSFKEGWGIVNIEANYLGLPVIGSNVSGIKDSILPEKTGLLFKYGDAKELSKKIKKILLNRELMKEMSKNSKEWALEFDWDKKAKEYLDFIVHNS